MPVAPTELRNADARPSRMFFFSHSTMKSDTSLTCIETGAKIEGPKGSVLAVSAPSTNNCELILGSVVADKIPTEKRRDIMSDAKDPGIDIYAATPEFESVEGGEWKSFFSESEDSS